MLEKLPPEEIAKLTIQSPRMKKKKVVRRPNNRPWKFSHARFAAALLQKREKENLSYLNIESATGVNVAILHRIAKQEGSPSMDTFLSICNWLNKKPETFF